MTRAIGLVCLGAALAIAGVALWSVPASLIVAGVLLAGAGLLINFED